MTLDQVLPSLQVPLSTLWLITDIAESKGKQGLFARQAPQRLKALKETALIQSVESSNRIEGVTVDAARLRPLVLGQAKPRDRSEEEISGYRQALSLIHTNAADLQIDQALIQRLHQIIQAGSGDAGKWKSVNNEIVELRPGQPPRIRFVPTTADATPAAMDELCLAYRHVIAQGLAHPLVAIATLVLDFLCIHPFRDGNGRVSRLLTLLALYQNGYEVGRYIGLERLVEEAKEDYYESLRRSSEGWHEGQNDLLPWLNHFLSVLRRAYRELEKEADSTKSPRGAKTTLIEDAINSFAGEFTLEELKRACPGASQDLVRKVLRDLKEQGKVISLGRGPGAAWKKRGNIPERG